MEARRADRAQGLRTARWSLVIFFLGQIGL
jgi:hypothetical protein